MTSRALHHHRRGIPDQGAGRLSTMAKRHIEGSRNGDRTQDVDSTKRSRRVAQLGLFDTASRTLLPEMKVI